MNQFQQTLRLLAALGIVACVSAVLFYWFQFRLLMTLYNATVELQQKADEWRDAFIRKKSW
jgi:cell division protein FtsL